MKKTFDFDFGNGEFVMKDGNPVILSGINALYLSNCCPPPKTKLTDCF